MNKPTTQFNPDDLIRQRMEYATEQHAKLMVENADLRNEIERLRAEIAVLIRDVLGHD